MKFIGKKISSSNANTTIERMVFKKTNGDVKYDNKGLVFKIGPKTWKSLFDHIINPLVDHVKKKLNEPKLMRNCKYLCLVGGLSCSKYFQYRMKTAFGPRSRYPLQVIIPEAPILSVVKGAAYFGLTHDYIKGRVLRRTYGHIVNKTETAARFGGVSEDHIKQNRYYDKYREKYYVKNCFEILATKNELILFGNTKAARASRASPEARTQIIYNLSH